MSELIPAPEGATELTQLRGLRHKVFRLADGRRKIVARLAPVHYVDEVDGQLKDIETGLRVDAGEVVADRLPFRFRVHKTGIGFDYESKAGGVCRVSLVQIGRQAFDRNATYQATRDRNQLTFANVRSGLDIVFRVSPIGIRAYRVLHNAQAPRTFRWAIEYDEAGEAKIDKEIRGIDAGGRKLNLSIANSTPQLQPSGRWRYFASESWNGEVRVRDPETRIASWQSSATYPVFIDPDITETISADSDDAYGTAAATNTSSSNLYLGENFDSGWRFQAVAVDNAATISLAELKFYVNSVFSSGSAAIFYGYDADSTSTWGAGNRIPSVTRTTASTSITKSAATGWRTVDVTSIVQEIVNRAGWASGNNMSIVGLDNDTQGFLQIDAREKAGTNDAVLEITLAGGGGGAASRPFLRRRTRFFRQRFRSTQGWEGFTPSPITEQSRTPVETPIFSKFNRLQTSQLN